VAPLSRPARPPGLVLSPDDSAREAVRAVVRFHLRAFAREEAGARAGEVEAVHQLRVATRRLRAAFQLFAPLLPARFVAGAERDMTWLGAAIGGVRDLDVLSQAVTTRAARLDAELRRGLGPLAVSIHDQRAAALTVLVETLDSPRCRRLLDRLASFGESEAPARGDRRLGEVAPELIRPVLMAALRAGRRVGPDSEPATIHRARIRAKRLRYALETLHGLGAKTVRRLVRRLGRLQDLLGEHQDAVTQIAWLRAYALGPGVPQATVLAVGALIHILDRRARRRRRRFAQLWDRIDRSRLRETVAAELARPDPRSARVLQVAS
jgi:CHAD domain-containing protein